MASSLLVRVGVRLDALEKGIKTAERRLQRFAAQANRIGRSLTTNITLPIAAIGTAAVQQFAKFERLELSLKALAEEGEDTAATMARLQEIARLPGIGLEQAIQGAAQLRTVGFEALQAEETLKALAKATTLSGGGPEQLQAVVRQITQINSKGRILQEDLGVILENVPSIGIALQDAFGTTNVEAIRDTGISTQAFTAEIVKAISANEKFAKAQGGIANDLENFGLALRLSLAELGRTVAESINLSGILQKLSGFVQSATERFKSLSPEAQRFIVIGAAVAAAIGPIILGLGAFIAAATQVVGAIKLIGGALATLAANPIGAAVVAIGILVTAFKLAYDGSERFRATIKGIIAVIKNFAESAKRSLLAPIKAISLALKGEFPEALQALKDGLGTQAGQTAGEAFSEAYNAEIARTIATRQAEQLQRDTALNVPTANTDLDSIFSGLPTTNRNSEGGGNLARNFGGVLSPIEKVSASLGQVSSILGENIGLTNEFSKSAAQLGVTFDNTVTKPFETASEALKRVFADVRRGFEDTFGNGLANLVTNIFNQVDRQKIADLNAELREQKDILSDRSADDEARAAAETRIGLLREEIQQEKQRGNIILQTAKLAISAAKEAINASLARAIAGVIAGESSKGLLGLVTAGIAVAGISALFASKVPKLKDGGIIPPGFEGDRFPAFLNSREVVTPLDTLWDQMARIFGGGNGEFVLRGQDLYLAMNRAERAYNRTGG